MLSFILSLLQPLEPSLKKKVSLCGVWLHPSNALGHLFPPSGVIWSGSTYLILLLFPINEYFWPFDPPLSIQEPAELSYWWAQASFPPDGGEWGQVRSQYKCTDFLIAHGGSCGFGSYLDGGNERFAQGSKERQKVISKAWLLIWGLLEFPCLGIPSYSKQDWINRSQKSHTPSLFTPATFIPSLGYWKYGGIGWGSHSESGLIFLFHGGLVDPLWWKVFKVQVQVHTLMVPIRIQPFKCIFAQTSHTLSSLLQL